MSDDSDQKDGSNYLVSAFISFFLVACISLIWPTSIGPFSHMFSLWTSKGTISEWLTLGLPLFAWGVFLKTVFWVFCPPERKIKNAEADILFKGVVISTWAGVVEEICFRWLIFLNALWAAKVISFCLCGFPEWLYLHLVGPIANFFTGGLMSEYLYHPQSWAVGSAIISANGAFRDGHKYQGLMGLVNSWYIGMFLFWTALTYGLWAAILLHFAYDLVIFTLAYVLYKVSRR